ncbi:hypothetical protein SAMD00019534_012000 [Acytostelium subglobosum LB1]|uniref:hypothetical protein n=1 Tax=Acytostelium subglobosum LB1 TaxID=1410327 RepID=UPI0006450C75|nr:hypothetical protein SAMD00019534_012000 [Acytostelium subglobosum LB1]GAM18025.1 hypothetical protein SAMD00019534_012000 [Acytostelium subglobosum LB1]|eukprot:XP_012758621.1 hypothetical protein SAMD00019534_012000 [Acytostelium subglobosum LB1]
MKSIILLLLLSLLSMTSAYYNCGTNACDRYWTCLKGIPPYPSCSNGCGERVALIQDVVNRWKQDGIDFVQVSVTVKNIGPVAIKDVLIDGAELPFTGTDLWNVNRLPNGDIMFPSYQVSLAAGYSFNFGYIARSDSPAHLWIKNIYVL